MSGHWRRALSGLSLLPVLAAPGCAEPVLLCRRPEVQQEVDRIVRQWNVYNRLDPFAARHETPTSRANAVVCNGTMRTLAYDPAPGGWQPRPIGVALRYDVQVVDNRLFVQVLP